MNCSELKTYNRKIFNDQIIRTIQFKVNEINDLGNE